VQFTTISWNLFHGRDFPPDRDLFTWRARLLRVTERNDTHVQVNRDLGAEFASVLDGLEWDLAILQESPPRYAERLARACRAEAHRVLTSRNSLAPLRTLAARINPDLIASGEGGSNLTLVRRDGPLGAIVERRGIAIHEGRPERRAMALTRTESGVCVANLHATNDVPALAVADVLLAARAALEFAGEDPLVFGGDLNLRPAQDPDLFAELADRYGLASPVTGPDRIDHVLVRGLEVVSAPTRLPPKRREVESQGLALRLSDHDQVEAMFKTANSR
jgi:endonuclease/exonuclease/phosphatase family metal-dependent hydrolase